MKKRIGLFGGTFDPPHDGHTLLALLAYQQLALDEVRWLPVGEPSHKSRSNLTSAELRCAMVALHIADYPYFLLDTTDAQRPPPHYTSTLLPLIHKRYPEAQLWWLIGADSLRDMYKWHDPATILQYCRLGVLSRAGVVIDWSSLNHLEGLAEKVDWLESEGLHVSSTQLRHAWQQEEDHPLLDNRVEEFMRQAGIRYG